MLLGLSSRYLQMFGPPTASALVSMFFGKASTVSVFSRKPRSVLQEGTRVIHCRARVVTRCADEFSVGYGQ